MSKVQYICMSHVDWSKEPLGEVFFFNTFDATGLCVSVFTGTPSQAREFTEREGLEAISPARLCTIWRANWPDFKAMGEAQRELDRSPQAGSDPVPPFKAYNAQFPSGRECATLRTALTFMAGWRNCWVEDATGLVVHGIKPEGGFPDV